MRKLNILMGHTHVSSLDFDKYVVKCGDCANFWSCQKTQDANKDICEDFEECEEEEDE
jgi:serine protease inhibitor